MDDTLIDRRHVKPLIIGGVNKAGTTSLYRYLANHPQICGSVVKEALFFRKNAMQNTGDRWNAYLEIFPGLSEKHKVCLEASPTYLGHGAEVARNIYDWLPNARLIFVLRQPEERFWSAVRSWRSRLRADVGSASLEEVIDAVKDYIAGFPRSFDDKFHARIARALERGLYAKDLPAYFDTFPQSQILVMFFEDLVGSPCRFVKRVCEFINVDESFYDNYTFQVENKTRQYRSRVFQKVAHKLNMHLERYFNQYPIARSCIRQVYTSVNEKKAERTSMPEELRRYLAAFYGPKRQELRSLLLRHYPAIDLAPWLD